MSKVKARQKAAMIQFIDIHKSKFCLLIDEVDEVQMFGEERVTLSNDPLRRNQILLGMFNTFIERENDWTLRLYVKCSNNGKHTMRTKEKYYGRCSYTELKKHLRILKAEAIEQSGDAMDIAAIAVPVEIKDSAVDQYYMWHMSYLSKTGYVNS